MVEISETCGRPRYWLFALEGNRPHLSIPRFNVYPHRFTLIPRQARVSNDCFPFAAIQVLKWEVIIQAVKAADARSCRTQAILPQVPKAKARKRGGAVATTAMKTDLGAPVGLEETKVRLLRNLREGNQEETRRREGRLSSTDGNHHERIGRMFQTAMVPLHLVMTWSSKWWNRRKLFITFWKSFQASQMIWDRYNFIDVLVICWIVCHIDFFY